MELGAGDPVQLVQLEWMVEVSACGGSGRGAQSHRLWLGLVSRLRQWLLCHGAAGYGVAVALLLCPPCCETPSLLWLPAPVAASLGEEPGWPTFVCPYPISQLWQLCVWTETQKCSRVCVLLRLWLKICRVGKEFSCSRTNLEITLRPAKVWAIWIDMVTVMTSKCLTVSGGTKTENNSDVRKTLSISEEQLQWIRAVLISRRNTAQ